MELAFTAGVAAHHRNGWRLQAGRETRGGVSACSLLQLRGMPSRPCTLHNKLSDGFDYVILLLHLPLKGRRTPGCRCCPPPRWRLASPPRLHNGHSRRLQSRLSGHSVPQKLHRIDGRLN